MKLIIGFALLLYLAINPLQAQKSSLPKLLIGEWTKANQSGSQINDTITLTKNSIESSKLLPRWKFDLPDKLSQDYFVKNDNANKEVIVVGTNFKWDYNKRSKLLRISSREMEQYFKILYPKDKKTIKLICVK